MEIKNNNFVIKNRKKSGYSMVEFLVVAILILIALSAAFVIKTSIDEKTNLTSELTNLPLYVTGVKNIRTNMGETTAGIDNDTMISAGLVPDGVTFFDTTGEIRNKFGGTIVFSDAGAGSAISFDAEYTLVPSQETCFTFSSAGKPNGFSAVEVDGTTLDYSTMRSDDLITACNSGTDSVTVKFIRD